MFCWAARERTHAYAQQLDDHDIDPNKIAVHTIHTHAHTYNTQPCTRRVRKIQKHKLIAFSTHFSLAPHSLRSSMRLRCCCAASSSVSGAYLLHFHVTLCVRAFSRFVAPNGPAEPGSKPTKPNTIRRYTQVNPQRAVAARLGGLPMSLGLPLSATSNIVCSNAWRTYYYADV